MALSYYFISFIDILGFSEMVRKDCHSGNSGPTFLPLITDTLKEARELETAQGQRLIQFSDSIIVSKPFDPNKSAFREFLTSVAILQLMLFRRGILCRGGIAHGKHSEEDDIIFSQGLVEAYRIESSVAQVPRVVVSQDLLQLFSVNGLPLVTDRDGYTFVHYAKDVSTDELSGLIAKCEETTRGTAAAAKTRWLADYCRSVDPEVQATSPQKMLFHLEGGDVV